ncbi:MAG: CHASE2 domain-containing protein [Phycisphaerales bacterium]|nr:MAG: CHASE2 domain-containing protein [Phycisphaerales bacterium]
MLRCIGSARDGRWAVHHYSGEDETRPDPPPSGEPSSARPDALTDADRPIDIPDYDLLAPIGSGGFGVVWLARNRHVRNFTAIKVLSPYEDIELASIKLIQNAVSNHPNLTPLEHVGRADGRLYIVMPLADNAHSVNPLIDPGAYRPMTLASFVPRLGRLDAAEAAAIGAEIAEGLAHMHAQGVAHGDVKPQNVLRFKGTWALGDYSLASFAEAQVAKGGTPGYTPTDNRSRIHADLRMLGVTLLALIGRAPGDVDRLLDGTLPGVRAEDAPLMAVIRRLCAQTSPGERLSAADAAASLRSLVGGDGVLGWLREWVRRNGADAARVAAVALISTALGLALVRPLAFENTPLNNWYWQWARSLGSPAIAGGTHRIDNVRVISMHDGTPLDALAQEAGLEGVSSADLRSLRRLHAEFCRRLADAAPRAVVWDIIFRAESEFDEDLAAGLVTLMERGVGVVVTSYGWPDPSASAPPLSPRIWETGARWGSNHVFIDTRSRAVWAPMVVQRDRASGMPSVILAAHAAAVRPDAWTEVSIDAGATEAVLRYWRPVPRRPEQREIIGEERIALTRVGEFKREPATGLDPGLRDGDLLGQRLIDVAPDSALADATISYEDAFRASPDGLRSMVRDRIVIIGDFRTLAGDIVDLGDRGLVPGPHVLASGVESVASQAAMRVASFPLTVALALAGAAVTAGATVRVRTARAAAVRFGAPIVVATALTCVAMLGGALWYSRADTFLTPFPIVIAVVLAAMITLLLVAHGRRSGAGLAATQGAHA